MDDITDPKPDMATLFLTATTQQGYFTAEQARQHGFGWNLLSYHTHRGRFLRVYRGLYRFRDYPSSPREDVMTAWLAVGKDVAVVSHESALELLELSDVNPRAIHLTVPRSKRHAPRLPATIIHTTTRPFQPEDLTVREGITLTGVDRSILDSAEAGTALEQIEMAVVQALERGLTTAAQLHHASHARSHRVEQLIESALSEVTA